MGWKAVCAPAKQPFMEHKQLWGNPNFAKAALQFSELNLSPKCSKVQISKNTLIDGQQPSNACLPQLPLFKCSFSLFQFIQPSLEMKVETSVLSKTMNLNPVPGQVQLWPSYSFWDIEKHKRSLLSTATSRKRWAISGVLLVYFFNWVLVFFCLFAGVQSFLLYNITWVKIV